MRERERITRICEKLAELWACAPDQRLGQFLSNYVYGHHVDIWHKEDSDIEKILDEMLIAKRDSLLENRCLQSEERTNSKKEVEHVPTFCETEN